MNSWCVILNEMSETGKYSRISLTLWNVNNATKQNENTLINTENKWVVTEEKGEGGWVKYVKRIKMLTLPIRN